MRKNITIAHVEPMGKSNEYARIFGVTDDARFPSMAVCIVHKSALPVSCSVGSVVPAAVYYGKNGLSFEPFCDTSSEGGVEKWVKEQQQ